MPAPNSNLSTRQTIAGTIYTPHCSLHLSGRLTIHFTYYSNHRKEEEFLNFQIILKGKCKEKDRGKIFIPKEIMHLCPMYSKELFKGTLKTLVLHLLQEEGRMYGYQITQRVRELSDGDLELTEGALYPTLHKLEKAGLIVSEKEKVGGRVRKYYRLSDLGTASARDYVQEFQEFVRMMNRILQLKPE